MNQQQVRNLPASSGLVMCAAWFEQVLKMFENNVHHVLLLVGELASQRQAQARSRCADAVL
jgi:hypothetical protein